jgi:hypothetical protein
MFLSESTRPASCEYVFERLRFSDSRERIAQDAFHEFECAERNLTVGFDPIAKVLPELRVEYSLSLNVARQVPSPGGTAPAIRASFFQSLPAEGRLIVGVHSSAT